MKYNYENSKKILLTPEYFLQEIHSFRKIMCSKSYTLEQKEKAWEGLTYIWVAIENLDKDNSYIAEFYKTTALEWKERAVYEAVKPLNDSITSLFADLRKVLNIKE